MIIDSINDYISRSFVAIKYKQCLRFSDSNPLRRDSEIRIGNGGSIEIGAMCQFNARISLTAMFGHLKIGNRVSLNRNCIIICRDNIQIGDDCIFGPNVVIYDHDHRFSYDGIDKNSFLTAPVIIEEGCWIGANVTILRGTHIGSKSVIGAGVIIKDDVPPNSLVIGSRENTICEIRKKD